MKTITQIADEIGVSGQALRNRMRKLLMVPAYIGGAFYFDEEKEKALKDSYKVDSKRYSRGLSEKSHRERMIDILAEQSKTLKAELIEKNKQIENLHRHIDELTAKLGGTVTVKQTQTHKDTTLPRADNK